MSRLTVTTVFIRSDSIPIDGSLVINEKSIIPVPENLPLDKTALAEPLSVSYQAVKHAGVKDGVSSPSLVAIRSDFFPFSHESIWSDEIYAFDLVDERLEKAKEVGATEALNYGKVNPVGYLWEKYPQGGDVSLKPRVSNHPSIRRLR